MYGRALSLGISAIDKSNYWLTEVARYYEAEGNDSYGKFMISNNDGFILNDNKNKQLEIINSHPNQSLVGVPRTWGLHWHFYANGKGLIQQNMKKAFSHYGNISGYIQDDLKLLLQKRIKHCNHMAEFMKKNSFKSGLYKFGWFF